MHQAGALDTEANLKQLLLNKLNYIANIIRTTHFYPYLLQEHVLDESDKQDIERGHLSNLDRATELILMCINRGKHAVSSFLTVLEYRYPDNYNTITGVTARRPPSGWLPSRYSTSGLMDGLMRNFTELMEQELKARLQSMESVRRVEEKLLATGQETTNQLQAMEDELAEEIAKSERLKEDKDAMMEELKQSKKSETQLKNEVLDLTHKNNTLSRELKFATGDAKMERERSQKWQRLHDCVKSMHVTSPTRLTEKAEEQVDINTLKEKHKAELDALKDEVKALESKIQMQMEEIEKLNLDNQELTQQIQKEKDQFTVLEDDYTALQEKDKKTIEKQNEAHRYLQDMCSEKDEEIKKKIREIRELKERLQHRVVPTSPDRNGRIFFDRPGQD